VASRQKTSADVQLGADDAPSSIKTTNGNLNIRLPAVEEPVGAVR
jgi:hypothetical protein